MRSMDWPMLLVAYYTGNSIEKAFVLGGWPDVTPYPLMINTVISGVLLLWIAFRMSFGRET